jgi:hypothetical protein
VKKDQLFESWLKWLDPIIPLKDMDRRVLGALITLHYLHKDRYSEDTLQELLMSEDTKKIIEKKLEMTPRQVLKAFEHFKEMGIITEDNRLQTSLTKYPVNNKFRILVDFEIID